MTESADLRVGIAGLGIASRQVIPAFKEAPGVTLTAVADVRPEALEEFGSWLGVKTFSSVQAMCESKDVEVVLAILQSGRERREITLEHQVERPF